MKHAQTLHLYRYWAALKGNRAAPGWRELQPRHLGRLLPDLFSLRSSGLAFGYAGSRLRARIGARIDGVPFASFWAAADQREIRDILDLVTETHRPMLIGGRALPVRRLAPEVEILLLPVLETDMVSYGCFGILCADTGLRVAAARPSLGLDRWQAAQDALLETPVASDPLPDVRREPAFAFDVIEGGLGSSS